MMNFFWIKGGVINSSLIALKHMSTGNSGKGGFIVNISSIAGLTNMFYSPVYGASKHAIISFTNSMAVSLFDLCVILIIFNILFFQA